MRARLLCLVLCLHAALAAAADPCAAVAAKADIHRLCVQYPWGAIYLSRIIIDDMANVLGTKEHNALVTLGGDVQVVDRFYAFLKENGKKTAGDRLSLFAINLMSADSVAARMSTDDYDGMLVQPLPHWTAEDVRRLAIWLDIYFQHRAKLVAQRQQLRDDKVPRIADAMNTVRSLAADPLTSSYQAESLNLEMKAFLARNASAVDALKQSDPNAYQDVLRFQNETKDLGHEMPRSSPDLPTPKSPQPMPITVVDPATFRLEPRPKPVTRSDWWKVNPDIVAAVRQELEKSQYQLKPRIDLEKGMQMGKLPDALAQSKYSQSPEAKQLLEAVKQELAASKVQSELDAYRKRMTTPPKVDPELVRWLVSQLQHTDVP